MTSACVSSGQMRAFLAGQLDPAVEETVARHVDQCLRCERLATELSDDEEARELATAAGHAAGNVAAGREVQDLCRRLHALGMYDSVLDDADSGLDENSEATAIGSAASMHDTAEIAPLPLSLSTDQLDGGPSLTQLGRYEIERTLGAGAFGIVYLATDQRLHRKVAIKVARASVLTEPGLRIRFFREAEAVARLEHPHIVPVYEADEIDGLCFLTLAYAEGPTLDQWLLERGGRLEPRLAALLMLPLVEAVEHAHTRGILHRDIKPGNVLLPPADEGDPLPVVPKLTDFGLAKVLEDRNDTTLSGIVLGTANYMAPEQAAGHLERIGPATDVYSLGAVLYQLLTGRVPIEGKSTIDTLRRLLIDEPAEVRSLVADVPEDLGAIARKCLHKSPAQRYATAGALASDLRQFLAGRPTIARPQSAAERTSRWLARHKSLVPLLTLAATAIGLSVGLFVYAHRLEQSQTVLRMAFADRDRFLEQAESRQMLLAQQAYANDVQAAGKSAAKGDTAQAVEALSRQIPAGNAPDLRGLEWHYLWNLTTREPLVFRHTGAETYHLRLSPDGKEIAAVGQDGLLRLYDAARLELRVAITTGQIEVNGVAYSRDGRLAATAGDDGSVRVFDLALREEKYKIAAHPGKAFGVVFYDNDRRLASCGTDSIIRLWDAETRQSLGQLEGHTRAVEAIAVSPNGEWLASASSDRKAMIWDLAGQRRRHTLEGHGAAVQTVAFSPDGRWLATGGLDNKVWLWDAARGKRVDVANELYDEVQSVAFSPDGGRLYVGDRRGSVHRFRVHFVAGESRPKLETDPAQDSWQAHSKRVWCIIPGQDADTFFTAGQDKLLRRWDRPPVPRAEQTIAARPDDLPTNIAFSADGAWLFVLCQASGVTMYDATTLEPRLTLGCRHGDWRSLAILEGRHEIAAGNSHGVIAIWNYRTGALSQILGEKGEEATISELAYSSVSKLLAALPFEADEARVYDLESGQVRRFPTNNHTALALSPDGRRLAVDSLNNVLLFDVRSESLLHSLPGHSATVNSLAFHPSGRWLVSGSDDRNVRWWSSDGQPVHTLGGHYADVAQVGFSPDGRTLLSLDEQGVVGLAHVRMRQPLLDIATHAERLRGLTFSADSRRFAVIRTIRGTTDVLIVGAPPLP
jgi:WD40 repeat protein/serine/threonine protein kinase